jgi:uncharacterized protein YbaP (TraB family)
MGLVAALIAATIPAFAEPGTACPASGPLPTHEMPQSGVKNALDHGFMWRISKDGRTSFLYGTIHVGKPDWAFPGPKVSRALQATDTVALELDDSDADVQQRVAKGMGELRKTVLPESLMKRMQLQAGAVCIPYKLISGLSPELQIEVLNLKVGHLEGLFASYSIDGMLAGLGHDSHKNVVSLETPELQLNLLQMRTPQETVSYVQVGLEELETGRARAMLKRIARLWGNSDYAEMSHFNEWCECLSTEIERDMMVRTLDERNPNLADRIDALHANGKQVFAAVGSLHMFGPIGLPTLMEKRGYRVERVDFKPQ